MEVLAMRAFERILIVLVGGLAVYLGYRLFLALPGQRDSSGEVKLPWNISVVFSRVGPGVFFALFGAAIVVASLHYQLRIGGTGEDVPTPSDQDIVWMGTAGFENERDIEIARERLVSGDRLCFEWTWPEVSGTGLLEAEGDDLSGTWGFETSATDGGELRLRREQAAFPPRGASPYQARAVCLAPTAAL